MISRTSDGTAYELSVPTEGAEQGLPVVLVHGLGLNRACWQWTAPALADTHRVLALDLYGHGESAAPPETPSLSLFARQVLGAMDACGLERVALVGFSLGGMIVRRIAQDAPARTAALAILHSPHRRSSAAQEAILERVRQARTEGPAATVEAALERWFTADFRARSPETMDLVRSWVLANDPAIYHTIYRVLADGVEEICRPDPPLDAPALVITGDEDYGNGPEMTEAIAAEISGAETVILPGLRHMALAEDPESVNRPLRRFLMRVVEEMVE